MYQVREYIVMGVAAIIAGLFIRYLSTPNGRAYGPEWSAGFVLFGVGSLALGLRDALGFSITVQVSRLLLDAGTAIGLISMICFLVGARRAFSSG